MAKIGIALTLYIAVYSISADFHEESFESETSSATFSVNIPGLTLAGEEIAVCSSSVIQQPIASLSVPVKLPEHVHSIEVFTCAHLSHEGPFECNTQGSLVRYCDSAELKILISQEEQESDAQFPLVTEGIVIRAQYSGMSGSKVDPITMLVEESDSSEVHGIQSDDSSLPDINEDSDWKLEWKNTIGSVSAVATNEETLFVFHRGDRTWMQSTFNANEIFHGNTSIGVDTILKCSPATGVCDSGMGKDLFYLPHGITVTKDEIIVTDVGKHQVMRLDHEGNVMVVLGQTGIPGDDSKHFCKPADAEVQKSTGLLFVADGYCNTRVAVFDQQNKFVGEIRSCENKQFVVVHDLSIDQEQERLFVADRENNRVCIYSIGEDFGEELGAIPLDDPVYAVEYNNDLLYTVNVPSYADEPYGLVMNNGGLVTFKDARMKMPHDLAVHENKHMFVADVKSPAGVLKFNIFPRE